MNNKTEDSQALRQRQKARTKDIKAQLLRGGKNSKKEINKNCKPLLHRLNNLP